ncbi:Craniofacial development protein 2 [Holothuria leucospilota]|uniref:Craniofacial development protein 2 n=1 Tax=Holothuria leucospilota TaxID=206669 RepID=A0A9Q1HB21_HOLLE|nr:Craniofacial development protein 2 [Holothuria leucospilota]
MASLPRLAGSPFCGKKRKQNLIVVTWNIRSLLVNGNSNRPERRTALIVRVLRDYNVDIAALQESRLAGEGSLREEGGYAFYWSGRPEEERRESGVCLTIKNCLAAKLPTLPVAVNDRIQTLRIPLKRRLFVTILNVYAPTMTNPFETKKEFYGVLRSTISSVPTSDKLLLLGDFNACFGREVDVWPGVIGRQGVGNSNTKEENCPTPNPRKLNISKLKQPEYSNTMKTSMDSSLGGMATNPPEDITEHWNALKNAILDCATCTLGKMRRKQQDWFDENDRHIQDLLRAKSLAYQALLRQPKSASKEQIFINAKSTLQR